MIVDHITRFVDIRILLFYFSFFLSSCMCIVLVTFINLNVFWACRRYSVVNELASLWKSLFMFSIPCASHLQHFCQSVKIVYNTNIIFYEVLCKVL